MDTSPTTPQQPGFFSRLLRFLNRLILAGLIGTVLGVAIFYGVPLLYRQFIQPVQDHTQQIQDLQANQDSIESSSVERLATLTARLETIELQSDANKSAISELETLQMLQATTEANLTALQTSVIEHQSASATLEASLLDFQENADSALTSLNLSLDSLEQRIDDLESAQDGNVSTSEMLQQLQILRSMQLLLRAEFYLAQDNYGLAVQDIQVAIEILREISPNLSDDKADAANNVISYLESALADLPTAPVVASNLLSTSWQILLAYLQTPVATPNPAASLTANPTPTVTLTPTPTAKP